MTQVYILGPNLSDQRKGNFLAHRDDCGDVQKDQRKNPGAFGEVVDATTRLEVAEFVYPRDEFEWDTEDIYVGDIWFAPCLKELR